MMTRHPLPLLALFLAVLGFSLPAMADEDDDDGMPPAAVTVQGNPGPQNIMPDKMVRDDEDDVGDETQSCDFKDLIGQVADDITASTRFDGWVVRILKPDMVVTQEFRAGRVNLTVDADGVVSEIACW